jgi:malonyl-CoA/methylmalonyl-CoA synthetase
MKKDSGLALIERAKRYEQRKAIIASEGAYSYRQLLDASMRCASGLLSDGDDLKEKRVAYLIPPGFQHVAVQWGIWRAGGIAVPLSLFHPGVELEYTITDADAAVVVAHPEQEAKLRPIAESLGRRFILTDELLRSGTRPLPGVLPERRSLILYTSGTTGRPKGVVITHRNIMAQVTSLVEAWGWISEDHILNVLPLNHIHGIVNILTCALWVGAVCELSARFDAQDVWSRILKGKISVFMAVPTIYVKLVSSWKSASPESRKKISRACPKMRLFVSGSAALPVNLLEEWKAITGHTLLERYGMTETGMVLSNPLRGERVPGSVGAPLPGVQVRLVNEKGEPVKDGIPGESRVKSPMVFLEYWKKPEATEASFRHGWFCTGDIAVREKGRYKILGRSSSDIIKTGGYKVSALEIEGVLEAHPEVEECAVVGIEDSVWGERVGAALVIRAGSRLTSESFLRWAEDRMAGYKIPSRIRIVTALPRNEMGKISKQLVRRLFKDE